MKRKKFNLLGVILLFFISCSMPNNDQNCYEVESESMQLMNDVIRSGVADDIEFPNSDPEAQWYSNAGLGLFMHWGIHSVVGAQPSWDMISNYPYGGRVAPPEKYYALAERFNPQKYNPDKWLSKAKDAGFKYAVLTTKHHDGYALWPSKYGIGTKQYMNGRDLLQPYVDACRKNGLKVGFYFSPRDWHYPEFPLDDVDFDFNKRGMFPELTDTLANRQEYEKFLAFTFAQIEELLTRYGKIDILWFDGMGWRDIDNMYTQEVYKWIRSIQPGIVINDRWSNIVNPDDPNGKGTPVGDFLSPFECRKPSFKPDTWWEHCDIWTNGSGGWGYDKTGDFKSWQWFFEHFITCRSLGGNFLPNVGPNPDGDMHPNYYEIMDKLEAWMKHSKESVFDTYSTKGVSLSNVMMTTKDNKWYLHLLPEFNDEVRVDTEYKPSSLWLLRTGEEIDFQYRDGEMKFKIPTSKRTDMDDVVVFEWNSVRNEKL
ncbi:alpha-L-fucosidase [Mariniphaga sediminis]|uniref:alpha-L-fucosidase n=1 Tax=Mariniphaga sediminis TaxID=1628158 RepID=UPI0035624C97